MNKSDYLVGSRNSIWWVVSFSMISDTLTSISYISVPGHVALKGADYFYIIIGNFVGLIFTTYFILPIYFKKNIISIYSTLRTAIHPEAEKVAATLFFAARSFGSSARLFFSATILYSFLSPVLPFSLPIALILFVILIYLYTWKGGIKSIIWTSFYQSALLILGFSAVFYFLTSHADHFSISIANIMPNANFNSSQHYIKLMLGGFFIAIAMNGLDQNMMQKSISCKNLKEAQKNILLLGLISFIINCFIVYIGFLLHHYYQTKLLPYPLNENGAFFADQFLTNIIFNSSSMPVLILFVIGLTAATFTSMDSVLTTLTTSVYEDLLTPKWRNFLTIKKLHFLVALFILTLLLIFNYFPITSMIDIVLQFAIICYGPLIGIFSLIVLKRKFNYKKGSIIISSILTIISSFLLKWLTPSLGYYFGLELLLVNSIIFVVYFIVYSKLFQ
jgi:Na+/proline symporter